MPEVSESHGCSRVDAENADTWKRGNTAHEETVKMLGPINHSLYINSTNWFGFKSINGTNELVKKVVQLQLAKSTSIRCIYVYLPMLVKEV